MPRYVATEHMVEAVFYDGSVDSAVTAAKLAGADATLVFPDGKPILRVCDEEIVPPMWLLLSSDGTLGVITPDQFATDFFLIDTPPLAPALPMRPTLADQHAASTAARQPGEIREGDMIRDRSETDAKRAVELLEVLEINAEGDLLCDWAWGQKTVRAQDAELVQAGG